MALEGDAGSRAADHPVRPPHEHRSPQIAKRFGDFAALDNVAPRHSLRRARRAAGPSGCGKTTLLRVIAGLEMPDRGQRPASADDDVDARRRARAPGRLRVPALRAVPPHDACSRTSRSACACKPRQRAAVRGRDSRQGARAAQAGAARLARRSLSAAAVGRPAAADRLARALAVEPKVLLLDEPFGALDAKVRKELRRWLRRLHDELHITRSSSRTIRKKRSKSPTASS